MNVHNKVEQLKKVLKICIRAHYTLRKNTLLGTISPNAMIYQNKRQWRSQRG